MAMNIFVASVAIMSVTFMTAGCRPRMDGAATQDIIGYADGKPLHLYWNASLPPDKNLVCRAKCAPEAPLTGSSDWAAQLVAKCQGSPQVAAANAIPEELGFLRSEYMRPGQDIGKYPLTSDRQNQLEQLFTATVPDKYGVEPLMRSLVFPNNERVPESVALQTCLKHWPTNSKSGAVTTTPGAKTTSDKPTNKPSDKPQKQKTPKEQKVERLYTVWQCQLDRLGYRWHHFDGGTDDKLCDAVVSGYWGLPVCSIFSPHESEVWCQPDDR